MKRSGRDTSLVLLLLFLVLAIAAGVRFYELGSQSLWADEGNSAALASRSLARIAGDAANDIHPPLYYWLLHLWTGLFGDSEAGLRSLSAALGVLLVLAIAELGRRVFNNVTGLVAGLVAAMAPFQVYYSQEARMYMLVALEGALAMLLFWWLLCQEDRQLPCEPSHGRRLRWLPFSGQLLVLVWALGLFTHYAFPLVIALASGLYGIWLIVTRGRGCLGWRAVRWVLLLLLTMGLYAPWTGVALRQLGAWPAPDGGPGLMEQLATIFTTLAFGPVPPVTLKPWTIALFLLALIGVLPWSHSNRAEQCGTPRLDWLRSLLPPAWLLAPAIMLVALGLYRGAYLKFLLIGSPALSLLLARAIVGPASFMLRAKLSASSPAADARTDEAAIDRGALRSIAGIAWIIGSIALVAATSGAALAHYFSATSAARDDYRGISQFIVATGQSEDAVVLTAPGQAEAFDYYYRGELPVYPLPKQRPLDPAQTQDDLFRLLEHRKVYAVYWATEEADPERVIERWLDHQGYKTLDQWYGNVRLAVYVMPERRAPEETATELDARFGPRISLLGYRGWNLTPAAGEVTQLQLLWQADQQPERAYKVFLQLLDPRDQVIAQRDAEPAGDSRPTTGWAPGETIYDNHGVLIPPGTPPGSYRRIVGLYDAETFERLRLPDGSDFVSLPPITVLRSQAPPPLEAFAMLYRQRFDFGAISLLGHDRYKRGFGHAPETPIQGGDLLHATFYWRANVSPRADWRFHLVLSDAAGNAVADLAAPLVSETYLTTMWQEGEIVRGEHDLMIPADLAPDTYRLSLVLLPDEATEAGAAYLGTVRVQAP